MERRKSASYYNSHEKRSLGDSPDSDYYHVISRVVDRQFVLREQEREFFRQLLVKQAAFAGVEVVAWCFMSNHFPLIDQGAE